VFNGVITEVKIKFCPQNTKNTFYTEGSVFHIYQQYKILFHSIKFKKMKHLLILLIIFLSINPHAYSQSTKSIDALRQKIDSICKTKKANIGVAIMGTDEKDRLIINKNKKYPMQSVYKLHLALAVLHEVDKGNLTLNQAILVKKSDLLPNTWSPMRDKYPEGNVHLFLSEILSYSVSKSDNNACDILFRLVGGPKNVHKYIQKLGIKNVSIKATEEEMSKDWSIQFKNSTKPFAAVQLLNKFFTEPILAKNTRNFLWKILEETTTGPNKIKGLLPVWAMVGHKTGASGTNKEGIMAASNDVGIVILPNDKHFSIAVFVSNTTEKTEVCDRIIAEISKAAWDYFSGK
jgi:beta-lactamase class A